MKGAQRGRNYEAVVKEETCQMAGFLKTTANNRFPFIRRRWMVFCDRWKTTSTRFSWSRRPDGGGTLGPL